MSKKSIRFFNNREVRVVLGRGTQQVVVLGYGYCACHQ